MLLVLVRRALAARPPAYWSVAGVLALALAVVVGASLRGAAATRAAWGQTRTVLVALVDLDAGDEVSAATAAARPLPAALVPADALTAVPAEPARLAAPAAAGEPILGRRLAVGASGPVAARTPAGRYAVAVPVRGAVPELAVGDAVVVVDGSGRVEGTVVDVGDDAVTVAVPAADLGRLAAAVATGQVVLAVSGTRSPAAPAPPGRPAPGTPRTG